MNDVWKLKYKHTKGHENGEKETKETAEDCPEDSISFYSGDTYSISSTYYSGSVQPQTDILLKCPECS